MSSQKLNYEIVCDEIKIHNNREEKREKISNLLMISASTETMNYLLSICDPRRWQLAFDLRTRLVISASKTRMNSLHSISDP